MSRPAFLGWAVDRAVQLYNDSRFTERRILLVEDEPAALIHEDGLWTYHAHAFTEDPRFLRAYARAVQAGGFDYRIRWRVHTILWAATEAQACAGAFVECGTGRGFMASAICEYLGWGEQPFYLFDSFLPTHADASGMQPPTGEVHPAYAHGPETVARNFAEWPGVDLVVGRIPESLRDVGPVAFLHVDLNNAVSEEHAVRHFWPRMSDGGVMVFDDYGFVGYEEQRASADRLAQELGFSVLALPTGQGLVVRHGQRQPWPDAPDAPPTVSEAPPEGTRR